MREPNYDKSAEEFVYEADTVPDPEGTVSSEMPFSRNIPQVPHNMQ